jgi:preprotein translocase subunit SecE
MIEPDYPERRRTMIYVILVVIALVLVGLLLAVRRRSA